MSSNNYVQIREGESGYTVTENDADSGESYALVGTHTNLRNALEHAETYIREKEVEYGIRFIEN